MCGPCGAKTVFNLAIKYKRKRVLHIWLIGGLGNGNFSYEF